MPATWLTVLAWTILGLAFASAAFTVIDIYGRGYRMQMPAMEAVWPVTARYARTHRGRPRPEVASLTPGGNGAGCAWSARSSQG